MNAAVGKEQFFKNPSKKSLHELFLEFKTVTRTIKDDLSLEEICDHADKLSLDSNKRYQVKIERRPALDKCWIYEQRFVEFHPFYPQFTDEENESFLENNQEFLEMLNRILKCNFHQFWCYVVHEPKLSYVLTRFLEQAVSPYAISYLNEAYLELYNEIYLKVGDLYQRLLDFHKSEDEYLQEAVAISYLKKNGFITARTIYLFCYLYNHAKPQLTQRLLKLYFNDQYKEAYTKELTDMLIDIVQEFDKLEALELLSHNPSSILRHIPGSFDPAWLEDTSFYILELAGSLQEFLPHCTQASEILCELELPNRLSHIYQKAYTQLYEVLEKKSEIGYDWSRYEKLINQWLPQGRTEFLSLYNRLSCFILNKVLSLSDRAEQERHLEIYLGLISTALDDDLFIRDFNKGYPLDVQFQMLVDNVPEFDNTQTEYLLDSMYRIIHKSEETESAEMQKSEGFPEDVYESIHDTLWEYMEVQQAAAGSSSRLPEPVIMALKQFAQLTKQEEESKAQTGNSKKSVSKENRPSEDQIEQRIKAVREMLPDLKPSYVLSCLELMDFQPEQVISRVLDNDLPFELLNTLPDTFNQPGTSQPKILSYVGKKPDYKNANDMLNDRKEKNDIKQLVLNASYSYDLDDDYDDRLQVHASFDRDEESKIYRHLKQPVIGYDVVSDPSSSSEEETPQEKPRNAFCEDPAVIRARRAAQRGRGFGSSSSRDVTGKPKGQGQDKSVQHNREKKSVHKSSRANHNRKGGAQWKRNKGMIPS